MFNRSLTPLARVGAALVALMAGLALLKVATAFIGPAGRFDSRAGVASAIWLGCVGWAAYVVARGERPDRSVSGDGWQSWGWHECAGRPRVVRLLAALACMALATVGTTRMVRNAAEAGAPWVRLSLAEAGGDFRGIKVLANDGPRTFAVSWVPQSRTLVGVRLEGTDSRPPIITALESDGVPITPERVSGRGFAHVADGWRVDASGALLIWDGASRQVTLSLRDGAGVARLFWLDRQASVRLSPTVQNVTLALGASSVGWAFLPAAGIQQIALEFPAGQAAHHFSRIEVRGAVPRDSHVLREWRNVDCASVIPSGDGLVVTPHPRRACRVIANLPAPVNRVPTWPMRAGTWLLVASAAAIALEGMRLMARRWPFWDVSSGWGTPRFVPRGRDLVVPLCVVSVVSLAVATAYGLWLPVDFSNDSLTYFELAEAFRASPVLASQTSFRTPGYPVWLAALLTVFGERAQAVALAQQILLGLLAPLTFVVLVRRGAPRIWAAIAALAVALSPGLRITGNLFWTELPFAVLCSAALLVFVGWGPSRRAIVLTGALAGAATMVRPNGLLVLLVCLGWLGLGIWLTNGTLACQRRLLRRAVLLLVAYAALAGPWHFHLWIVRNSTDLSLGWARWAAWSGGVLQRWVDERTPANAPQLAVWGAADALGRDPYYIAWGLPEMIGPIGETSDEWLATSIQQAMRHRPREVLARFSDAMWYGLTLDAASTPALSAHGDIAWTRSHWVAARQPSHAHVVASPTRETLERLVTPHYRDASRERDLLLDMNTLALRHWRWLTCTAIVAALALLFVPADRAWALLVLVAVGNAAATASLGWAVDRYIVINEPLLILVVAGGVGAALRRWAHPRATVPAAESERGGSGILSAGPTDDPSVLLPPSRSIANNR